VIYLITGATGTVGSLVVDALLAQNAKVRILARNREKAHARFGAQVEVFTGDSADAGSLTAGLEGANALFLVNSGPDLAAHDEGAAKVAKESGVAHLVKLSSYDALEGVGTGKWHARGEAAIRASGLSFTFVQPSGFMSNALFWAGSIRAEGVVRACTGEGRIPFIHPRDIADVAAKALSSPAFRRESLPITGPDALTYAEMAAKIGAAFGKTVRFQPVPEGEVRQLMQKSGDSEAVIDAHLSIYRAIREQRLARVTDTVQRVLGRKPITFDEWIKENAAAFAAPVQVA
jgi:(4-alkanoyl-5-oxo-2,5-dihydrofuran-3-yl)methyl phosphate reductase